MVGSNVHLYILVTNYFILQWNLIIYLDRWILSVHISLMNAVEGVSIELLMFDKYIFFCRYSRKMSIWNCGKSVTVRDMIPRREQGREKLDLLMRNRNSLKLHMD